MRALVGRTPQVIISLLVMGLKKGENSPERDELVAQGSSGDCAASRQIVE